MKNGWPRYQIIYKPKSLDKHCVTTSFYVPVNHDMLSCHLIFILLSLSIFLFLSASFHFHFSSCTFVSFRFL